MNKKTRKTLEAVGKLLLKATPFLLAVAEVIKALKG